MLRSLIGPCLRNCLFGIADPGVHRVGRSIAFSFFFSASNPFEMQAKLYAELTDDIFRYYSVPKNSQLKHKTSLSELLSEAIKPTIVAICSGFSDVLHFATGVALQCGEVCALFTFAVHIVRRLHSPQKKSVLIESKRPINLK